MEETVVKKKYTRKLWTEKEDLILANAVARSNGANLAIVFKKVAKRLKRSPSAVEIRWYCYVKKKSVSFAIVGPYGTTKPNTKNGKQAIMRRHAEHASFWKKLKDLFKDEFFSKKKTKSKSKKKKGK